MKLASRLHLPLQECRQKTTAQEFAKWNRFFYDEQCSELQERQKWEFYAARLCSCMFAANGHTPPDDSKFLIQFELKKKELTQVTKEQRVAEAKTFWSAFFAVHGSIKNPNALTGVAKK